MNDRLIAEQMVLGACMLSIIAYELTKETKLIDYFFFHDHKTLYQAIIDSEDEHGNVDILGVSKIVKGPLIDYLLDLTLQVPAQSASEVIEYMRRGLFGMLLSETVKYV